MEAIDHESLTTREAEVLSLVEAGLTNDEIAGALGITRNAVRYHLKELHGKLGTGSDRGRLRAWQRKLGLAVPGLALLPRVAAPVAVLGLAASGYLGVRYAWERKDPGDGEEYCAVRVISKQEAIELGDERLEFTPQQSVCASTPEGLEQLRAEIAASGGLPLVYPTPGPPRPYGTPPAR